MKPKTNPGVEPDRLTDVIIANICTELSDRNWSLKMLADKADLPYESVKKLISHKIRKPSFLSIWQIANALDCSVDKLAGREDPSSAVLHRISEDTTQLYRILTDLESISGKRL